MLKLMELFQREVEMQEPGLPEDEAERLATLNSMNILDTPRHDRFDRYTRISTRIFDVPVAVISLIDRYRQWFKSTSGLDVDETPRNISFCGHAILGDDVFEVRNARRDARFRDNPLVMGQPHIVYYAGAPLEAPNGHKLGTLCLIDRVPRHLSDDEKTMLKHLADMVVKEMVNHIDTETGLDNRNAMVAAGTKCIEMDSKERRFSLHLFDITEVVQTQTNWEGTDSPGETFAKLLHRHFPTAASIAYLGREDFCILLKEDESFDEAQATSNVCTEARELIYPDARFENFSTHVGCIRYDPGKHAGIDDMLHAADKLFFERDAQSSKAVPGIDRTSESLDRWRRNPH